MVMLTWETLSRAWMDALNDHAPDKLAPFLTDDFKWATHASDPDGLDRARTLEFIETSPVKDGVREGTIYESEDVLVGTHTATVRDQPTWVLCVAKLRGDKVYEYHHARL